MRSLSGALAAALGAPVQQPALLVEVGFSTPRRWSSFATVVWNGQTWTREAVRVEGLAVEALRVRGTLIVQNADDVMGALVLNEGVTDRSIRLWGYDAAATAAGDVVWLADAAGAACQITPTEVRIGLRHPSEYVIAPRTFVGAGMGANVLLPAGSVLRINGRDVRLERR